MTPERLKWLEEGVPRRLGGLFAGAGHQLYLVGGSVRDALLGRPVEDLDFATDARPDRVKELLEGWADHLYDVGAAFGTIGAVRNGVQCEITTFRADVYLSDSRLPQVTFGDSIEADLERRDFTVNAVALKLGGAAPELVDTAGGLADIAAGVLRTPIGPETSFSDDPLRMVRLFRFMSRLGFTPQPAEVEAVSRMKERLRIVSAERIRDEFSKLVVGERAAPALMLMIETGLAEEFVPEIPALAMTMDPSHRHKDVLAHSLAVMAKTEPDLVLRLAALFHDVGKPGTRRFDGPKVTFHHHEALGARMTRRRLQALRYPKEAVHDAAELVFLHMRTHTFKMGWTDSAVRRYVRDAGHLLSKLNQLARCDVTTKSGRRARRIQLRIDELEERIEQLRAEEELADLRPSIDGHQVMAYLGIPPGPAVGEAMKLLLEKRIEDGPCSPSESYALLRRWALSEGWEDPGPPPPPEEQAGS